MKLKNHQLKILFELSVDARVKQSTLASKMKMSPQRVKYVVDQYREKKMCKEHALVDPASLGYINILVVFAFKTLDTEKNRTVLKTLKETPNVVRIDELAFGADLLVTYAVSNLSFYNKMHTQFLDEFHDIIKVVGIYPVFVQHLFKKNYLHPYSKTDKRIIISGDRSVEACSVQEEKVLNELVANPLITTLELSRKCKIDPKTAVKIMKVLLRKKILRGFSIDLDLEKLEMNGAYVILSLRNKSSRLMKRFVQFCREQVEIVQVIKLLGLDQLLIRIESKENFQSAITALRKEFACRDVRVFTVGKTLKNTFIPKR